jgi:hypothetical protein
MQVLQMCDIKKCDNEAEFEIVIKTIGSELQNSKIKIYCDDHVKKFQDYINGNISYTYFNNEW